jgi:YgiT-type zinc finger domain-containing protein
MEEAFTSDFTDLGTCMVIIKNVPCYKCKQCGEIVFTGEVAERLEQIIDALRDSMTEVAIVKFTNQAA